MKKWEKLGLTVIVVFLVLTGLGAILLWEEAEASIDYAFNYDFKYQKEDSHWVTVNWANGNRLEGMFVSVDCRNRGSIDGTFSLVIEFTNATFSNTTSRPYLQVNNSTVKFPFMLHENKSQSTEVFFIIDNDTTSFNIKISIESSQRGLRSTEVNWMGVDNMQYVWNESTKSFSIANLIA